MAGALDVAGPAVKVLADQHDRLIAMLTALDRLGVVGTRVINASRDDLLKSLDHLAPERGPSDHAMDDPPAGDRRHVGGEVAGQRHGVDAARAGHLRGGVLGRPQPPWPQRLPAARVALRLERPPHRPRGRIHRAHERRPAGLRDDEPQPPAVDRRAHVRCPGFQRPHPAMVAPRERGQTPNARRHSFVALSFGV